MGRANANFYMAKGYARKRAEKCRSANFQIEKTNASSRCSFQGPRYLFCENQNAVPEWFTGDQRKRIIEFRRNKSMDKVLENKHFRSPCMFRRSLKLLHNI